MFQKGENSPDVKVLLQSDDDRVLDGWMRCCPGMLLCRLTRTPIRC